MAYLAGLQEYLDASYHDSVFDQAVSSEGLWNMHLHDHRIIRAAVAENLRYDIRIKIPGQADEIVPKVTVKFLYPEDLSESVQKLLKTDKKVKAMELEPILAPGKRYHVKNKSLFPLMKEKKVVFFTLLEGEILRGIVGGFSRYEITVKLKGGIPVTLLRHSIYDLRDKKGRCFLKSFQEKARDWQKSDLFSESSPDRDKA